MCLRFSFCLFLCFSLSVHVYIDLHGCVGFRESSLLIICARTAGENYDADKRMKTATGTYFSCSSCSLSLFAAGNAQCRPQLDQRTNRRREKDEWDAKNLVIYFLETYTIRMHSCLHNDDTRFVLPHFPVCFTSPISDSALYKHVERARERERGEMIDRLMNKYTRGGNHWLIHKCLVFLIAWWSDGPAQLLSLVSLSLVTARGIGSFDLLVVLVSSVYHRMSYSCQS